MARESSRAKLRVLVVVTLERSVKKLAKTLSFFMLVFILSGCNTHVRDLSRGKVFCWIAKLNEAANNATFKHFPQLETQANANEPLEVSVRSNGMGPGNIIAAGR